MVIAARILLAAGIVLVALYLLLRLNSGWIYLLLDRAKRNSRTDLSPENEVPRFFRLDSSGNLDRSSKWPGWDGWYFFFIPLDESLPVKMVRCSLMSGLYGLEGIDNYDKVLLRLENSAECEFLSLIPTTERIGPRTTNFSRLSHHYLPKSSCLEMELTRLDVSIRGLKPESDEETEPYGQISGRWPRYQMEFTNPETGVVVSLTYVGENVHWWADIPGLFTYFAAWGKFEGQITYPLGTSRTDEHRLAERKENYRLEGFGCFEHGCARKPMDFDLLWGPLRLLKRLAPNLRFIRYHYELFSGDNEVRGGFMVARGFGIDFRNRGGIFLPKSYQEIHKVAIEYCSDPPADLVDVCVGSTPTVFYRKWKVRAQTSGGDLEYTAYRDFPPALVAANMFYYHFRYEGIWRGKTIKGRGYGEYAHI